MWPGNGSADRPCGTPFLPLQFLPHPFHLQAEGVLYSQKPLRSLLSPCQRLIYALRFLCKIIPVNSISPCPGTPADLFVFGAGPAFPLELFLIPQIFKKGGFSVDID